ncbi:LOW QUALITY PROTEIN: hypothetical protein PHMEG_00010827 [Phytophthora megakarya]|uniref:Chromo domain-containing protein n=1 Tax=Phytophthora megakarya TaxID=4795 RepID=A0A225WCS6_9STRA|nr:LOW QUALITY PROTEIN: hypothetical protein PHMEG_00010827 [Phytophthora megakarya]
MLGKTPTAFDQKTAYGWRRNTQRQYEYAQAWAKDLQAEAKSKRSKAQTRIPSRSLGVVQPGSSTTWIEQIKSLIFDTALSESFKFQMAFALKIEGTVYKEYPWMHVSRLKPRDLLPDRPSEEKYEFDAALLPEDASEPDEAQNVYEVEASRGVRWVKRTCTSQRVREYLMKWIGYTELQWLPVSQLNCGALLCDFNKSVKAQARLRAMQSGDTPVER